MSPETAQYLAKAEKLLDEAAAMLRVGLTTAAARSCYLAGFHAAQAFISEGTGRAAKTHKGVHTEFLRLTKDEARVGDVRGFLSRAYNLKAIADYETGPDAEVSKEDAERAFGDAARFLERIASIVADHP